MITILVRMAKVSAICLVFFLPMAISHLLIVHFQLETFAWIYAIQFILVQLFLAGFFGIGLLPNKKPLITTLAENFHDQPLDNTFWVYTRQVTLAWVVFFLILALVSGLLFVYASHAAWSFFCNFLYFPLIAAMFIGEYAIRKIRLPHVKHASIMASWTLYQAHAAQKTLNKKAKNHSLKL